MFHPRYTIVKKAGQELSEAIMAIFTKHHLTPAELLSLLNAEQADVAKFILSRERHPNEPGKSADEGN